MHKRFTIVESLDPLEWDNYVADHPKGSIFHTRHMVEVFKRTKKYLPLVLAAVDDSRKILALLTSVRIQLLPSILGNLSSRSIFYAEPLSSADPLGQEALAALVTEHDVRMRKRVLFSEVRPLHAISDEVTAFQHNDYQHADYLNFVVDLRRPSETVWRNVSNTCRANIRRGEKKGLTIEDMTCERGVDILYDILTVTYTHVGVPLADKSLFVEALQVLRPLGQLKIFVALYGGEPVGASILLLYKKVVYEWYWGVKRTKSLYPAESITWHRINWGIQHGYDLYDFGGAGWPNKPYGVRDFKAKFGGQLVNYGRLSKIYSPWKFELGERAYRWRQKLASSHKTALRPMA